MPREQSPERKKARELFDNHDGNISNREIAGILGISEKTIGGWKSKDNWTGKIRSTPNVKERSTPKKRGGQPGNKNATGPPRNRHAEKHGFFMKWLPVETMEILEQIKGDNPLDLLWDNIQLQYAAIVRAQQLMHVSDKNDMSNEISMSGEDVTAYEVQYAWDKQANFMGAQSRAMKTLESMIKNYEELLSKSTGVANEEQHARLELLKAQTRKIEDKDNDDIEDDGFIDAIKSSVTEDWQDD